MALSIQQKAEICKYSPELKQIQSILSTIKKYGTLPKGKAYLFSRYKSLGLIDLETIKRDSVWGGGKTTVGYGKVYLTKKGKHVLNSIENCKK